MKTEEDIFDRLTISYIGEKLLILGLCIWVSKTKFSIKCRLKIVKYLDSILFICPTYQISEILKAWKYFSLISKKIMRFSDVVWP